MCWELLLTGLQFAIFLPAAFADFSPIAALLCQLFHVLTHLGVTRHLSGHHLPQEGCPVGAVVHAVADCIEQAAVVGCNGPVHNDCRAICQGDAGGRGLDLAVGACEAGRQAGQEEGGSSCVSKSVHALWRGAFRRQQTQPCVWCCQTALCLSTALCLVLPHLGLLVFECLNSFSTHPGRLYCPCRQLSAASRLADC